MAQFTESEAQAILEKVLGYSKADECEATLTGGKSGNLRFARNAVSTSGGREVSSLEVQSSFGKKTGTATVNEFDDASLEKVVRRAEELAQLAPEREDVVGVAIDHLPDVGEHEVAPAAHEQPLAERALEHLELPADRRLREVELARRRGDAPLARDDPEVEQVVVVDPFHGPGRYVGSADMSRRTFVMVYRTIRP